MLRRRYTIERKQYSIRTFAYFLGLKKIENMDIQSGSYIQLCIIVPFTNTFAIGIQIIHQSYDFKTSFSDSYTSPLLH